jgi:uncharacterized protein YcnI
MADVATVDTALKAGAAAAAMAGGKRSKWLAHVKKTMKAHKGKSLKAVLKMAKKTYKGGAALSPQPISGGKRKTRRGTRRH